MRKAFIIVTAIFVCISVYFGGKMFLNYLNELNIVMTNENDISSTSGTFAFKETPENTELVNSYLKANSSLISEMSKEVSLEKNIKNTSKLISKFPTFKDYYAAKLKVKNAVFEGIPYLYDNALKLSDKEFEVFFNDNSAYLDKTFGITTLEQLRNIVSNISLLQSEDTKNVEILENSVMYNPYGGSTFFRLKVGNNSDNFIYFSINAFHGYETENQKAPIIVFNAPGGMS